MKDAPRTAARPADGLLVALLGGLADHVPVAGLDELWIFPPRRVGNTESAVVVAAAFDDAEQHELPLDGAAPTSDGHRGGPAAPAAERRRILTARYTARRDARGQITVENAITEHGTAPADRIGRLIDGVLHRLDDTLAAQRPRTVRIGGDPQRWAALLTAPPGAAQPR